MTAPTTELNLACQPGKEGSYLIFPYQIRNEGNIDAYVMDAVANVNAETGEAAADRRSVVVVHGPGEEATVGRFVAPLPPDRRIAMPVVPLARLLVPGATLEGRVDLPMPLAETSPYFADLTLRQYDVVEVKGVVFCVGYWLAGSTGLAALPAEYAPDLYALATRDATKGARLVSAHFGTKPMQLFRRTGAFPRLGGG